MSLNEISKNKRMIEKNFDIPFIADLALRENQIQQNCRPIIAVHKWFARWPGHCFGDCHFLNFRTTRFDGLKVL
jgi:hypothetical protein